MRAQHITSSEAYRHPYGAVCVGENVVLRLDVWDEPAAVAWVRVWIDGRGELLIPMERCAGEGMPSGAVRFEAVLTCDEPGVVWYRFNVQAADGAVWLYGAREGCTVGEGAFAWGEPPSFRLVVFAEPFRAQDPADGEACYLVDETSALDDAARALLADRGLSRIVSDGAAGPHVLAGEELGRAIVSFITGAQDAPATVQALREVCENAAPGLCANAQVALSEPGGARLLTRLGDGKPDEALTDAQRGLAVGRLWSAMVLQVAAPGVPCVHAGDEAGAEGIIGEPLAADFAPNDNCLTITRNALALRKAVPLLAHGMCEPVAFNDDVLALWHGDDTESVCVLANRSLSRAYTVSLPLRGECVDEVIGGKPVAIATDEAGEQAAQVFLWPLGTAIVHFHAQQRLQKKLEPGRGVICHITSLPHTSWPGTLGAPALRFVNWLADEGYRYWQVLPVNPTDEYHSPYAGVSAFAGNTELLEDGVADAPVNEDERRAVERFAQEQASWLVPYATFLALKERFDEDPWWKWPSAFRAWDPRLSQDSDLQKRIAREMLLQYRFAEQWNELRAYAHERGVQIIGDMPMYVAADSADVWAHRALFAIDEDGVAASVAGCPPDQFTPDGQIWGNPTYRWDVLRAGGYAWWMERFRSALARYDVVRLDHFLGFSSYFAIPAGEKATEGAWRFGPGRALFEEAFAQFGPLPFIAEDLGIVTPAVRALRAATGFSGMDVIQFADGDPRFDWTPQPEKIVYLSTHDTQTFRGWMEERYGAEVVAKESASTDDVAVVALAESVRDLREKIIGSDADIVIEQLQDALGLGDEARMNVPGTAKGNWLWQAEMSYASGWTLRAGHSGT